MNFQTKTLAFNQSNVYTVVGQHPANAELTSLFNNRKRKNIGHQGLYEQKSTRLNQQILVPSALIRMSKISTLHTKCMLLFVMVGLLGLLAAVSIRVKKLE